MPRAISTSPTCSTIASSASILVLVPTRVPGYIYNSFLAETTVRFRQKNWVWGRVENTDRDSYVLYEEAPFVRLTEE